MAVTESPLVGRETVLSELRAALAVTAAGKGGCVVINGPAGIGKSRLLDVAVFEAADRGMAVAPGRATELDRMAPLTTLMTALGRSQPPGLAPGDVSAGSDDSRFWLIDRLGEAIEDYVRSRALLIVVDDAQWADELSALALRVLVPALAPSPVLWLLGRRPVPARSPAQDAVDWLVAEGATEVPLGPLADDAVAELCAHVLGARPDATVLALAGRSGGNPFLLEQILTALRGAGQVRVDDDTATLVGDELPLSFLTAVDQRLRGLSPDARRLLELGSVLGRPFTLHTAAELMRQPPAELIAPADEAVHAGALVDLGLELSFRHDLLREAVYNNMSGPVRSVLHREAADVVRAEGRPPAEIAEHLIRSGHHRDQAVKVLREAATQVAAGAPGTAADLVLRTLDVIGEHDPTRPELIGDAVRLLASAGRLVEAKDLGEAALHAGLEAPAEAALLLGLSEALKHAGHNAAVVEFTARGLSRTGVPEPITAQLLAIRAHALLYVDDLDGADQAGAQATELGGAVGEHAAAVFGSVARSVVARARGRLDEAVGHAQRAAQTADSAGGAARQRHPRLWLGSALAAMDRFDEADGIYTAGQREADRMGTRWSQPLWHFYRASLLTAWGRLDDATAEAEAGLRIAEQLTALQLSVPLHALMAQLAVRRGEMPAAGEHIRRAERLLAGGITVASEDLWWALAMFQDATGQPAAAVETLAEVYDGLSDRLLLLANDPGTAPALVRLARQAGATGFAEAAAAGARRLADRNPGVASLAASAAHAQGLVHGDADALRAAVEHYRTSPRLLARASAVEDTGVAEHAAGRRRHAVALLEEALELYASAGAARDESRVQQRLRGLGSRRRAAAGEGTGPASTWSGLTHSELRVVRLVAEGLTNREVADRLYLSPHTVDSHLRHVFTKLGVNSRVELTRHFVARDGMSLSTG